MTAIISMRGSLKFSSMAMLLAAATISLPLPCLFAQEAPKKIDVSKLSKRVEDVVIPVPSEIFNAFDKLGGSPNWNKEIAPDSKARPKSQAEFALLLGSVIANGFIAVQAKDASRVKEIGKQVLGLSDSLSVREVVLSHCNSINDAADRGNWNDIRGEFDKAQKSVREAMDRLNSKDLSELISIGGWLRGTDALTSLTKKDYSADRAELLHQPELVQTFDKQLSVMNARIKGNPLVVKVQETFKTIKPMVESTTPDAKTVEKINAMTSDLLKVISPP